MRLIEILLLIFIFSLVNSCSVTMPILATHQNRKYNGKPTEITIPQLSKGDEVIITTNEFNTYIGKVLYFSKIKSNKEKIYTIDLNKNDTITVATQSSFNIGKFQKIESDQLITEDDVGDSVRYNIEEIIAILYKGEPKYIHSKRNRLNDLYNIKLLYANEEITFTSNDIQKIEKMNRRVNIPKAALMGMMTDILIVFFMILRPPMNLPIA